MDAEITKALENDKTIDITTMGRKSGQPQRIEIWFHNLDGRLYIPGNPGPRDWYANMLADAEMTFHLKGSTQADIPATAQKVSDPDERQAIVRAIYGSDRTESEIQDRIENSPIVEITLKL